MVPSNLDFSRTSRKDTFGVDFTVSYEVRLSDTSTGGSSDLRTKRITFGEGYIVVGDETGGRVFPIDRLIRFTWRAAEE